LDPTYFVGTIVLTPAKDQRVAIIDGQQRLATTALLFAAIAAEFSEAGEISRAEIIESQYLASRSLATNELEPRITLNEEDSEVFEAILFRREVAAALASHERISEAYDEIRGSVRDEVSRAGSHWQDALYRWVTFIDSQVQVLTVLVDNDADAFLLFETLNDRGMDLTVVDLLKNHLFGLARTNLEPVQRPWVEAMETLDSAEDQTTTTFVRHYWSSINGATRERGLYRSLKRHIRSADQASDFVEGLRGAAYHYAALLDPQHDYWLRLPSEARDAAGILASFGLEQYRPLLLAAMELFADDELRRLLESLVSWSVRGLIVGGIGGGTAETAYTNAAVDIRRHHLQTTSDVLASLETIVPNDEQFAGNFETATVYRIKTALYLLLAIERDATAVDRSAFVTSEQRLQHSAEAILPRSADPDAWPGWSDDQISALARRLGNFALLPAGTRLSRLSWEERRIVLGNSGLTTSASVGEHLSWSPDDVRERQRQFADRAPAIWPVIP
jgi:Protein of unknown function DUF262/Protein of unknown function (DUF1524)